ncbi:MAG: AI-2E family transporter, partial [Erysipelotrichaceae bacterium]
IQLRKVMVVALKEKKAQYLFDCGSKANRIFSSFISGQLLEACILGVLYYISMRILNFPFPELISALIAICSIVPVFGSMFAMSIGAIMILSINPITAIWFVVFYQLMQQFEDNVIYPRVVGNSVGLPGLWVLLSIFVFGDLFGILGMVMAVPTTAFIYTMFADFINQILKKRKLKVDLNRIEHLDK